MKLAAVVCVLALGACFSKPTFTQRDAGSTGDDGGGGGDGFDALDAAVDASPMPFQLALAKLSAGGRHVCAIGNDSRLWCWGDNGFGQLGDTPEVATGSPALASTAQGMGWTDIAAGIHHTCGIYSGAVWCWGLNEQGQSDPTNPGGSSFMKPVTLPGAPASVFAGGGVSCAILTNTEAYCWGTLDMGVGGSFTRSGPTRLFHGGAATFVAIALADDHGCGISTEGRLVCWGVDAHNALGHDVPVNAGRAYAMPAETTASVSGERFRSVDAARGVTCAVTTVNDLFCWGSSDRGHQLGSPDDGLFNPIDTQQTWDSVAIDDSHACARTTAGAVHCWGGDVDGALGKGDFTTQLASIGSPVNAGGLASGFKSLVAGDRFTCVLNPNNEAYCWGANRSGELGNREIATKDAPSRVRLPPLGATDVIRQIVTGFEFTCALVGPPTGAVTPYCWGRNSERQVDVAMPSLAEAVPKIASTTVFTQISAGEKHVCGLQQGGASITCWGDNASRQLGRAGAAGTNPIPMPSMPWTFVAAGSQASCGISDGNLSCWGSIPGAGSSQPVTAFNRPSGARAWRSLSIGSSHAVGVADEVPSVPGRVHMFGFGDNCPSGVGTTGSTAPTAALELKRGSFASAGDEYSALVVAAAQHAGGHTCIHYQTVENATPRVSCFGANSSKQVNETELSCSGNAPTHLAPAWQMAVDGAATISTASGHSCAIAASKQLYCWGGNSNHELGGLFSSTPGNPAQVNSGAWSAVSTGYAHTCVVDDAKQAVYCWGENKHGQVGDGTRFRPSPVASGLVLP